MIQKANWKSSAPVSTSVVPCNNHIEKTKTFPEPIVIEITQGTTFYPAEDFHQNYYQTNPLRYKFYRLACGRDLRLAALWGTG